MGAGLPEINLILACWYQESLWPLSKEKLRVTSYNALVNIDNIGTVAESPVSIILTIFLTSQTYNDCGWPGVTSPALSIYVCPLVKSTFTFPVTTVPVRKISAVFAVFRFFILLILSSEAFDTDDLTITVAVNGVAISSHVNVAVLLLLVNTMCRIVVFANDNNAPVELLTTI